MDFCDSVLYHIERAKKCLKNYFLDLENSWIRIEPPPSLPKTRINTTEIFGPHSSSSYYKRLVTPNMKTMNGWNNVNSKMQQIILHTSIVIYASVI